MNDIDIHSELFKEVYQICMKSLTRREYSRSELSYKLLNKNYSSEIIKYCLDYLIDKGFQSDERYADMLISARINQKYGPSKIKMELKQKGISSDIIEDFIDEKDKVWFDNIQLLISKKIKLEISNLSLKEINKLKQYLIGRGYGFDLINRAFSII